MSLTDEQREQHVCCVKPRLCKEDHYHERDVVRLIEAERERIALAIEAERDARHVGIGMWTFGATEPYWLSDEPLDTAAKIARESA